jgi:site-specific DNA-methyltransferase (adenine-specific)
MWEKLPNCKLGRGDCLELMKQIPDGSVDMILCDLPYGTTACKWDTVIPFERLWDHYKRIVKPNSAIVLTASQPFTSALVMSNISMFKYAWIWEKERPTNFFAAKFMPLNNTEDILIFSDGGCNTGAKNPMPYFPQGIAKIDRLAKNSNTGGKIGAAHKTSLNDGREYHQTTTGYPKKIIKFNQDASTVHPTQKPVALMEYLIKTYTNENAVVLDNCMGSGTTGVACVNLGRRFIGIEKDESYYNIAKERIAKAIEAKNANET